MHSKCTVHIQYMCSICRVCVKYIYSMCTVHVQYMYSICTHKCTLHRLAVRFIVSISKQYAGNVPENTDFLCDKPVVCGDTICTSKHMTPGSCRLRVRREHNVNVSSVQVWYFLCRHLRHHLRYVFPVSLSWAPYLSWDIRAMWLSIRQNWWIEERTKGEAPCATSCYHRRCSAHGCLLQSEDISPSSMCETRSCWGVLKNPAL